MNVTKNASIGDQIWYGQPRVVEDTRELYRQDQKNNLLQHAVALYSFRNYVLYGKELRDLYPMLFNAGVAYINDVGGKEFVPGVSGKLADKGDVLSTHLEWLSRREDIAVIERRNLARLAEQVVKAALPHVHQVHTGSLLRLTLAQIHINRKEFDRAHSVLISVAEGAPLVKDKKQRVRVYAKLGVLLGHARHLRASLYWGIRACLVTGVPMAVRLKALAALLNIER